MTEEIKKALSLGYKVLDFFQVWHYEDSCKYNPDTGEHGIFSEYVNTFHKLKTAFDGFPAGLETLAQKLYYIKIIENGDKIKLTLDEIKHDPGIRSVAKALSNNLWGKQAINLGRSKTVYFTKADNFFKVLRSPKVSIDDLFIVNDEMIRVTMKPEDDFIPVNQQGILILAVMTTSFGRMCLYVDTDSLFYIKRALSPEIPLGPLLGEFKDELKGDKITCFVGCGPKSYG